jgi:hypothetical protein
VALKDRDAFGAEVGRRPFRNLSQEALVLPDEEGPRALRAALQQGCNHASRLDLTPTRVTNHHYPDEDVSPRTSAGRYGPQFLDNDSTCARAAPGRPTAAGPKSHSGRF